MNHETIPVEKDNALNILEDIKHAHGHFTRRALALKNYLNESVTLEQRILVQNEITLCEHILKLNDIINHIITK